MTHQTPSTDRDMEYAHARAMLEIYGAERRRWPEDARALFDAFSGAAAFEVERAEAALLDDMLAQSPELQAGDALKERLMAAYAAPGGDKAQSKQRQDAPRRRGVRFIQGGALAGLMAIGFAIGVATANDDAGIEKDPAFSAQMSFAFASGEGDALWAENE